MKHAVSAYCRRVEYFVNRVSVAYEQKLIVDWDWKFNELDNMWANFVQVMAQVYNLYIGSDDMKYARKITSQATYELWLMKDNKIEKKRAHIVVRDHFKELKKELKNHE